MNDRDQVAEVSREIAAAIARRDVNAIRQRLAPGFVHRSLGGDGADAEAFLQAIAQIPGEIRLVTLEQLEVDLSPSGALVTGVQLAHVALDGQLIEDRRAFVDWFVKGEHDDAWRIQAAVDLPHQIPV
jgi:ketosteroid isomerase-like protein